MTNKISSEIYIVHNPAYKEVIPAQLCRICGATARFASVHFTSYPHKDSCKYLGSKVFSAYLIGPNVTLYNESSPFPKIIQETNPFYVTTHGPYEPDDLFPGIVIKI